jgi:hypothetical protein
MFAAEIYALAQKQFSIGIIVKKHMLFRIAKVKR